MPTMAIGNGSAYGLESSFAPGKSFCDGTLPLSKLECGAICAIFANDPGNFTFGDMCVNESGGKDGLKYY